MEEWPPEKRKRVYQLIRELDLDEVGGALDFGCENVFTGVLKHALPGWEVCSADISRIAITSAQKRYPECRFLHISEIGSKRFDFVFSSACLFNIQREKIEVFQPTLRSDVVEVIRFAE